MSNIINLAGNDNRVTFNFGEFSLDFNPTDEKSEAISNKASDLKTKADQIKEDGENVWETRKTIKGLLDEFFGIMFDGDAPVKIFEACGQNTLSYLKVFMQIAETIQKEQQKQLNDENFKKYLAE